ncbi:MAG: Nramp family divalent metal transporter [Winkia neuii]|uniref:Divalent metal cation transporter MntH n=1 Tax=Winkia neuii TaxID=33007 RepID=A0A2I1IK45_9ACTO|nr:Nramp family divalent metal transporter [Winkia neuii]OFJ70545.1 divalent metal cation transporter [Actinomyces sp. HMSC064C12]OFK00332.1 divalent metal cation transporter [Actinomyces sp. HMSC072A03]OFT56589.1 divalent metal cation transporter [Actinomyces sp. HMSC06A08]KWZ72422.1 manganese transport protein MntH [Winkia neuii]MDK8099642.1 Nramp family divalent metal transporter [Winkia neuii]
MSTTTLEKTSPQQAGAKARMIALLGPAFVAAVAYVDPGNVAANITAGAKYGYLLVWVLVLANAMAVLVQYQSAKLGLVTGKSLPQLLGDRMKKRNRIAFWLQAEIVAAATDLAEVIGGAIALNLLFHVSLLTGAIITGFVSILLLLVQGEGRQHIFERVVVGLLLVITFGFMAGLFLDPPSATGTLSGLLPRLKGTETVLLAASMLGATVMPHAIYLHSSLVNHRFADDENGLKRLLRASKFDVTWALILAGLVNIGLLLLAASSLFGVDGTDTIEGAHGAIVSHLGSGMGIIFGIGLLASGLASTSVGAYAGSEIMLGLLHIKVPLVVRRLVTLIPALIIVGAGMDPTLALVWSQALLSVGIPFAIIPLMRYTAKREIMGDYADSRLIKVIGLVITALIVCLNIALLYLTVMGIE